MIPSHPSDRPSSANERNTNSASTSVSQRAPPSAWSSTTSQQSTSRRVLAPISTSTNPNLPRPTSSSHSPHNPWSPVNQTQPASSSESRTQVRSSSISSTTSPFPPPPSSSQGNQSGYAQGYPSRSRTTTTSSNSQLASTPGSSQSVASVAANGSSSRLSRASPSLSQSGFNPSTGTVQLPSASAGQSGQLSKIVSAQLSLLLSTIKDDKDRAKWESQREQIRKLVQANGMEVFTKYFRRLLTTNAAQIWSNGRTTDTSGSYPILVEEVQKITQDQTQAEKICESIEFGDGEVFKDFDLATFMDHFAMKPVAKIALATAFTKATRSDLRIKADKIIQSNLSSFLESLSNAILNDANEDMSPSLLAAIVDRLARKPPEKWNNESYHAIVEAIEKSSRQSGVPIPVDVVASLSLFDLVIGHHPLIRLLIETGPKATETLGSSRSLLESVQIHDINYQEVASSLLFMVIARPDPPYDPDHFITALRQHRAGQRLDWQDVLHAFDREGLQITKAQFKGLFDALMPLAHEYENFDIQLLWGGDWHWHETQLSFATAFLSFSQEELDASRIPRLRQAFTLSDFQDAPEDVKQYAEMAVRHPLVSLDAAKALFNMVFRSSDTYARAQSLGVVENIINMKMDLFVASVSALPKPWGALQDQAMKQLVSPFFFKNQPTYRFVFHILWKRDRSWLEGRLLQFYQQKPANLTYIFDLAQDQGWMDHLVGLNVELSLDLAAYAHGKDVFDFENWLTQLTQNTSGPSLHIALSRFLQTRAEDEILLRDGQSPSTVSLTVKTVHAILSFLGTSGLPEDDQVILQRACIHSYPRLVNYGEGHDAIIDLNGKNGNGITPEADNKMQDHFKLMYSGATEVREVIEALTKYKASDDPKEQDLFACIIFGLFDEYNCFATYPLEALATTAVLFGGVINYDLLSRIALKAALSMVLEAVRDFNPNETMYRFGLQALLHFRDRLPEWRMFSERLLEVPGLRGTPIEEAAQHALEHSTDVTTENNKAANDEAPVDSFLAPEVPEFTCIGLDDPPNPEDYEDPDEMVKEGVLFILNNLSERNLDTKLSDLRVKLHKEHYQWFAHYLVDQRIKTQPNYHVLYMNLLETFGDRAMWNQVLKETYSVAFQMLNAESTMNSSHERTLLKHIALWLGSMTLAKNVPIRHRNISFKDLLIEAHDTNRLIVAIPFTCCVVGAAADSQVFKLPCAWTMEVLQLLLELYSFAELKLQLKFEIEIFYKKLGVDEKKLKDIPPSEVIRFRPSLTDPVLPSALSDGIDGFSDISLMNINRRVNDRFSPATLPEFSDLESSLRHNYPLPGSPYAQARIRQTLTQAVERAMADIIGAVVERSVTIAAISTSQLIAKDFALEPDENRYRDAAHNIVKSLSGSLALVTCKEPLRTSISTNIRNFTGSTNNDSSGFPEGAVLMFVNDNLDIICSLVEKAAETASINEIDNQISDALALRRTGQLPETPQSRWSYQIPDPYKPSVNGLNPEQLAIYEEFGRSFRGSNHLNTASQDSGRQIPDVLQEQYSSMTSLGTPAEPAVLLRSGPGGGAIQSGIPQTHTPQQLGNGFSDADGNDASIPQLAADFINEAVQLTEDDPGCELLTQPSMEEAWHKLRSAIATPMSPIQKDALLANVVDQLTRGLYQNQNRVGIAEVFAKVLSVLSPLSESTQREIYRWTQSSEDALATPILSTALLKYSLVDTKTVDTYIALKLQNRSQDALPYFNRVIDEALLTDSSQALRGDFAQSISALTYWLSEDPNFVLAQETARKLADANASSQLGSPFGTSAHMRDAQIEYIFDEWNRLVYSNSSIAVLISFIHQLDQRTIVVDQETALNFFRTCLEISITAFENADPISILNVDEGYMKLDALAKLMVLVSIHMRKLDAARKGEKDASYFDGILSVCVLTLSKHYNAFERFNQRIFLRLFSTMIFEISNYGKTHEPQNDMMMAFAKKILPLSPHVFPGFSFSWLSLISHWMFVPSLLKIPDQAGYKVYCDLLTKHLVYLGELIKPFKISRPATDLYRGTVTLFLVLHHDFPEFLAENHFQLLNAIPAHCIQLRSLIISAAASAYSDQPDPFTDGLKIDRLDEYRRSPVIRGDPSALLKTSAIKEILDDIFEARKGISDDHSGVNQLIDTISNPRNNVTGVGFAPINADINLIHALVLYTVQDAELKNHHGLQFNTNTPHAKLIDALTTKLSPEPRYHLLSAIINQLRYPNSHTNYFSQQVFHLLRAGQVDQLSADIQAQVARVLLERLLCHRPHPWGLIVTTLEIFRNRSYRFWDLQCIKGAPDIETMFRTLFQQMGQTSRA